MSIQSHTVSHPDLAERVRQPAAVPSWWTSRQAIQQALDRPVYALAYPAGSYSQRVIQAAKAAGYVMAVATSKGAALGPKSVFEITRRRVQALPAARELCEVARLDER